MKDKSLLRGTALVTGGTSGMGYWFAKQLAERGLDLVLVARNQERLELVAEELRTTTAVSCEIIAADLTVPADFARVKARLMATENPVTVFVNNAGAGLYTRIAVPDATEFRHAAELMALAPMELGGAAASQMKERGSGVIINTCSVASYAPMGAYGSIKAFLTNWSDSLSVEVEDSGVQVVTFQPSWVHTEFHARTGVSNSSIPDWIWLDAETVVAQCLRDVERGKTLAVPDKHKILVFLARVLPKPLVRKAVKKLNKGRR